MDVHDREGARQNGPRLPETGRQSEARAAGRGGVTAWRWRPVSRLKGRVQGRKATCRRDQVAAR